ncbi:MAG TPA: peptidoglycan DD-metalloendopeptidase family protein [Croceibacterium sp.]|nr:peptidoglycan DD-metalloendopeptidase family protein [Croceibacterium sp.]
MKRGVLILPALALLATAVAAQQTVGFADPAETRRALQQALAQSREAEARGKRLDAQAARATEAADKTAREAAALAARIQQAEASIGVAEARLALIEQQRTALGLRLAQRQQPLVRLTAALQRFARRPLALSVLRPGSVREIVYLRAMLSTAVPEVRRRTRDLRHDIARGEALRDAAFAGVEALRDSQGRLQQRKAELAALETRQRLASRRASGVAARESERALALAEEARDLDTLVDELGQAGRLRAELAALPGPIVRPARPVESVVVAGGTPEPLTRTSAPAGYQLPVTGRAALGFGAPRDGGTSQGLTLVPREGAQVVAPAAGRVAFAGSYRGYGRIVIIEHEGGWTSLVTGLARTDVAVGDRLVAGAPLGVAAPRNPSVTLELRRDGAPVNPLDFVR